MKSQRVQQLSGECPFEASPFGSTVVSSSNQHKLFYRGVEMFGFRTSGLADSNGVNHSEACGRKEPSGNGWGGSFPSRQNLEPIC